MPLIRTNAIELHYTEDGAPDGPPVLLLHALGLDHRVWDPLLPHLPPDLRLIRCDLRGHGRSTVPPAPYGMQALVHDAAGLLDALGVSDAVVVGLSLGGLVAQGLAAERPDLVAALVLSNTAAKIGTEAIWQDRADTVRDRGVAALADGILARWFPPRFRQARAAEVALWRDRLCATPAEGYAGCCAAIGHTDLFDSTARLRLPALAVAGALDGATPADMVRETAALIPGCAFHLLPGTGHLPCVQAPEALAALLDPFLAAHAPPAGPPPPRIL
ncbi:3-oxoadipate enol-lactonase [Rhodobacteraceae bacterium 2CG4]|uniref:3-oxoadipate enol-lactonase n=1 Tax=Halovulum marinum TaxID=2662447 RepID=A0A6L5Z7T9_9RHOB|nr:3-oxoadipate enol-lactonase [Halovulum marinum]MSU92260.1 3-oxoadipate enol-lactonase [Halovulum marinum]